MPKPLKISHCQHKNMIHMLVYVTGLCNYSCEYCSFGKFKSTRILDLQQLKKFLVDLYYERSQDIYVELIGGEPTLISNIIEFSDSLCDFYPHIKLGIYTNFSLDFKLYEHLIKNKTEITFTWHSTKTDKSNISFIDKSQKLLAMNIDNNENVDIHIMYEIDALNESIYAFNILVENNPYNVELCLLDRDFKTNKIYFLKDKQYTQTQLVQYNNFLSKQKTPNIKRIYEVQYDDGSSNIHTIQDVQNNKDFYNFKFWKCDAGLNYFYIDDLGDIYPCFCYAVDKNKYIANIYNYNIKNIRFEANICKYNNCPCVWEATKQKILGVKK